VYLPSTTNFIIVSNTTLALAFSLAELHSIAQRADRNLDWTGIHKFNKYRYTDRI
jgi:hypothetical protein